MDFEISLSQQSFSCHRGWTRLSAGNTKRTHLGIEQSCAALGSSWDPSPSPIQSESPQARPSSLPCQFPFVVTGVEWWIEGSISWSEPLERVVGVLAACHTERGKQHISREQQFASFIDLVVYQRRFCQNSIYNMHTFQTATQPFTHSSCTKKINSSLWKHVL